jgi:DNA-binding response OmpR family regulator
MQSYTPSSASNDPAPARQGLKVFVVDNHEVERQSTVDALCRMGHIAQGVASIAALDAAFPGFRAELLVIGLPEEETIALAQRMRVAKPEIGIVILSAFTRAGDKVAGYLNGADLYLSKPIQFDELGAAIQSLARRIHPGVIPARQLILNPQTLQLQGPLGVVNVSHCETVLLSAFAEALDHRLDIAQLIDCLGKTADGMSKGTLEVQIVRLRKKLEQAGGAAPNIKAIRGAGYQLCLPLTVQRASATFTANPNLPLSTHNATITKH